MKHIGKVIAGALGFVYGGPVGLILGLIVGHLFDQALASKRLGPSGGDAAEIQATFFTTTFSAMGYVSKADGRVSEAEIEAARRVMDRMSLSSAKRREAIDRFNDGKRSDFDVETVVGRFRRVCRGRVDLYRVFMEIQLQTAFADGQVGSAERRALMQIARALGLSDMDFARLEALLQGGFHRPGGAGAPRREDRLKNAYQVLGLNPQASDSDVKKAYRRLISQHHPDKLVSKGLPQEMMKMAEEKSREITSAYDLIKEARGMT